MKAIKIIAIITFLILNNIAHSENIKYYTIAPNTSFGDKYTLQSLRELALFKDSTEADRIFHPWFQTDKRDISILRKRALNNDMLYRGMVLSEAFLSRIVQLGIEGNSIDVSTNLWNACHYSFFPGYPGALSKYRKPDDNFYCVLITIDSTLYTGKCIRDEGDSFICKDPINPEAIFSIHVFNKQTGSLIDLEPYYQELVTKYPIASTTGDLNKSV